MVYDISNKVILNGIFKIELTKIEWQIFEMLLEYNGEPLSCKEISNLLWYRYYVSELNLNNISVESVKIHINKLNKKFNGLITIKRGRGCYIEDKVKIIGG